MSHTSTSRDRIPAKPEQLETAFREFVEATRELEISQQKLSEEVRRLTENLAQSNADLKAQMSAKARIAQDLATLISALPTGVVILQHNKVYAFNDISARIVPGLKPDTSWKIPSTWKPIDSFHFQTRQASRDVKIDDVLIVRPERRKLEQDKELLLIHDVTATFKAREEAEREAKLAAMGRITAEIAHQLRTPLATATIYASHLADPTIPADTRLSFVAPLNQQLGWLDQLVSRMMGFLRHKPNASEMVTVSDFIDECCASIEPLFKSRRVSLDRTIQGGRNLLSVQRAQLRGGIVALLENALQFSSETQTVRLRAIATLHRLTIHIDDEGPGIANDMLSRIFEPFATGSAKGTGLGLAIAKSAVEDHGGQIHAANKPEGGAVFQIVLPVLEPL